MPSRSLNVQITGETTPSFTRAMRAADKSAGDLNVRFGALSGSIGQMAPMMARALPAISGMTSAAVALGASLAEAGAGAGALGAGFAASLAPIAVVGKQVSSRMDAIKEAYQGVVKAQQDGTAESKKASDEMLSHLSKNERAMVGSLGRLSALQKTVLGGASDGVFGGLSRAIDVLAPKLEGLSRPFTRLGQAIGDNLAKVGGLLASGPWQDAFKKFVDSATKIVGPITSIFTHIGGIIRDVAVAALPYVQDALKGIADWFGRLDKAATTSKIGALVDKLVGQTKSWLDLFGALGGLVGRVFGSLFDDAATRGKGFVDTMTGAINAVNGFIDQIKSGEGAGGEFRNRVTDAFNAVKGTVVSVVRAVKIWLDKHRDDIRSVVDAFKTVAKFAKEVFLDTVLPNIKRFANAVGPIFDGIYRVIRGVVRLVSGLLSGDWAKTWSGAKEAVSGAWKAIKHLAVVEGENTLEIIKDLGPKLVKGIVKGIANIGKALATGIFEGVKWAASHVPGMIGGILSGLGKKIVGSLIPGGDGIGRALVKKASDGIGMLPSGLSGGNGLMGAKSIMAPFASLAGRFGLHTSSGLRPGSITSSGNVSWHSSGNAIDEAGTPAGMLGYFRMMKARFGPMLRELIYTPGGVGIKDGRPYRYTGQVAADHFDHVHVAFTGGLGDGPGRGDGIGQIKSLWTRAGGSPSAANMAAAIAMAESGGNPGISHRNSDGSIDRGLWQINSIHGAMSTFDRLGNARAAVSISSNGRNWNPWTVYKTGAYRRFLTSGGGSGGTTSGGSSKSKNKTRSAGGPPPDVDNNAIYGVTDSPVPSFANTFTGAPVKGAQTQGGGPRKGVTRPLETPDTATTVDDTAQQALIDALNAAAEAEKAHTEALNAVRDELKANREFATSVSNTSNYQLTKTLADLISGHIVGRGVAGRAFTPGTGVEYSW